MPARGTPSGCTRHTARFGHRISSIAPKQIRYRGRNKHGQPWFELEDGTVLDLGLDNMLTVNRKQTSSIGLTSLRNAMVAADTRPTDKLYIASEPGHYTFTLDWGWRHDVQFELSDDGREILVSLGTDLSPRDPEDAPWRTAIPRVLMPLLKRHGCSGLEFHQEPEAPFIKTRFSVPHRGKTVADALTIAEQAWALVQALDGGALTLPTTLGLIQTGFASALVDQEENNWLEAKQAPYRLGDDAQKYELAKDVAAFANTTTGGVILIGAGTRKAAGGDVVANITDIPLELISADQHRKVIGDRVHPLPERLDVRTVEHMSGRGIAYIHIPAQREELRPFLVKGTIIAGRVTNSYVSIPERAGQDTRYSQIAEIHALLQVGRVALKASQP